MPLTPDQARVRLAEARQHLKIPLQMASGREGFDIDAMRTMAIKEIIDFLEDALA